jgi:prefoldin subunit 5
MRNDQDIANLILYIQTEIQLFQTTGESKHLENCLSELQRSIDDLEVRPWYDELIAHLRDQLGRIDEWN